MKILLKNTKGASLPLVTGLIVLIFTASIATNELVLRNLRSVQNIEASNRAYLAAEAGIEDALYELSNKEAGYETSRTGNFQTATNGPEWKNNWSIKSLSNDRSFIEDLPNEGKLVIPLYKDTSESSEFGDNIINSTPTTIENFSNLNNLSFTLSIPSTIASGFDTSTLQIDSDADGLINEDPNDETTRRCRIGGRSFVTADLDCDGRENEDGPDDRIILWKLSDGLGNTLTPVRGCLGSVIGSGSEICESDFNNPNWSLKLDKLDTGIKNNDPNTTQTIQTFLNDTNLGPKFQMEFTVAVPLVHKEAPPNYKEIKLPKLDVTISSDSNKIPRPLFTIESDGYYQDFKQSITTSVLPKTIIPLFDFTFIQQRGGTGLTAPSP